MMEKTDAQKYWDACLIRNFRMFGTIGDAFEMFKSIAGVYPEVYGLRRLPSFLHRSVGIRVFVASFLPLVNDRLHDPKTDDVAFLNKLCKSKYDTQKKRVETEQDRELNNIARDIKAKLKRIDFERDAYRRRNRGTDWGVVKSSKAYSGRAR